MPLIFITPYNVPYIDPTPVDNIFDGEPDTTLPNTPMFEVSGLTFTNAIIDFNFRGVNTYTEFIDGNANTFSNNVLGVNRSPGINFTR